MLTFYLVFSFLWNGPYLLKFLGQKLGQHNSSSKLTEIACSIINLNGLEYAKRPAPAIVSKWPILVGQNVGQEVDQHNPSSKLP